MVGANGSSYYTPFLDSQNSINEAVWVACGGDYETTVNLQTPFVFIQDEL